MNLYLFLDSSILIDSRIAHMSISAIIAVKKRAISKVNIRKKRIIRTARIRSASSNINKSLSSAASGNRMVSELILYITPNSLSDI